MLNPVWVGLDAEVGVFLEDDDGVATGLSNQSYWNHREYGYDQPLFEYCYWQDIKVDAVLEAERRQVPGLASKKITTRSHTYEIKVQSWYFKQSVEFDVNDFQSRETRLTIVLANYSPYKAKEEQIFLRGCIIKGVNLNVKEGNPVQEAQASFWAESFWAESF